MEFGPVPISDVPSCIYTEDEEPPAYSAFGFRLDPEFMDTEDRSDAESEPESEEEEEK